MSDATTPTPSTDESDIAYLKRLASAGRGAPAPFLLLMAVFGGVYGLSLLIVIMGVMVEGPPSPTNHPGPLMHFLGQWLFAGAHLLFLGALIWTIWRTVSTRGVGLNRAAAAIWSGAFVALLTTYLSTILFTRNEPPSDVVYAAHFLGPILLILWGSAWWATAIASDRRWLIAVAVGSFGAAIVLAYFSNQIAALPIMCGSLILLAFLPAVLLMLERRA